ncbi:hypothetical protein EV361DRAFT_964433, partial [Lentinula raphanica]
MELVLSVEDLYLYPQFTAGIFLRFAVRAAITARYISLSRNLNYRRIAFRRMSANNSLPPIQSFGETRQLDSVRHFLSFSDSVISIARGYGLEGYLDGSIPRPGTNTAPAVLAAGSTPGLGVIAGPTPNNSPNPSQDEWEIRNARLAAIIYLNAKDPRAPVAVESTRSTPIS